MNKRGMDRTLLQGGSEAIQMPSNERILSAASRAARSLGYCELREKQAEVLEKFVSGHDVFAVLPTGYGKSLCYACLPGTFDLLFNKTEPSIVVVVSPLVAIMNFYRDQTLPSQWWPSFSQEVRTQGLQYNSIYFGLLGWPSSGVYKQRRPCACSL